MNRRLLSLCLFALAGWWLAGDPVQAQDKDKDQKLPKVEVEAPRPTEPTIPPETPQPYDPSRGISWSSNAITSDSQLVGSYNQPVWTTQRPFTAVRTYVLPEGEAQLEQWYRPRWKQDGTRNDRILEELAIGLPYRFQLDIYARWNIEPHVGDDAQNHYQATWEGVMVELRWALANWGVIPLNPTLYAEWVQRDTGADLPDKYELKLLLADQYFHGKLFYASNFILEKEVGGEKENELGFAQAFATPIIERKLMGGVEMWYRAQNVHDDRGHWNNEMLIGPALQFRPTKRTFLDTTLFWGCNQQSPKYEAYFIFGYQFGKRAGPSDFGGITPASLGQ